MKKVFLLIVSLFFAVNALAQTKVKGVVVDSSNQPLIGAGIVQVGNTTNGTVSDIDGSFSLNVPETASLQVSCVGYTTKIVNIEGRTQLTIILDYCCPLKVSEQRDIHPQCCCNGIADDFSEGKPLS